MFGIRCNELSNPRIFLKLDYFWVKILSLYDYDFGILMMSVD